MITFKRNDYTKKEISKFPWLVERLYYEFSQGFQSSPTLLNEAAIKYPEYFNE